MLKIHTQITTLDRTHTKAEPSQYNGKSRGCYFIKKELQFILKIQ